ncbi:hypothetical protein RHO12_10300 [Orbus sturtevantii]|uniref:hypothetical protein n=1 Tax=Orbus sturtevantii TaxID=3074109 RepID=UPI00370D073B
MSNKKTDGDDLVSISNKLQFLANNLSKPGVGKQLAHILGGKFGGTISVANLFDKINKGTATTSDYLHAASDVAWIVAGYTKNPYVIAAAATLGLAAYVTSDDLKEHLNILLNLVNEYGLADPDLGGYLISPGTLTNYLNNLNTDTPKIPDGALTAWSPIIVDLDRDGIETLSKDQDIHFDLNTNTFAENTGWVGADDGLLVLDLNSNGLIDDGQELFGDNTVLKNGTLAKNGYQALAEYDENGDGVIDAKDSIWENLKVWQDKSSNGYTDENELLSLKEAGISSISTKYLTSNYVDDNGNEHRLTGKITYTDGTEGKSTDVWFSTNQASKQYLYRSRAIY